jgi:hypothetical protein
MGDSSVQVHLVGMRFVPGAVADTVRTLVEGLRAGTATFVPDRAHAVDPFAVGVHVGGARLAYVSAGAGQNRRVARWLLQHPPGARPLFRDVRTSCPNLASVKCVTATAYFPEAEAEAEAEAGAEAGAEAKVVVSAEARVVVSAEARVVVSAAAEVEVKAEAPIPAVPHPLVPQGEPDWVLDLRARFQPSTPPPAPPPAGTETGRSPASRRRSSAGSPS